MFDFIRKIKAHRESETLKVPGRINAIDIDQLGKQVKELSESKRKLERIIQNHVHGKITYNSNLYFVDEECMRFMKHPYNVTYIYKNGKEYEIKGLCLGEAEITQGVIENILWIEDISQTNLDKLSYRRYVVDLSNCSFKRVE